MVVTSENKERVQQERRTYLICHGGTSSQVPTYIPRTLAQIWKCFQGGIMNKQSQNHCFLWCAWSPPGFALLQAGKCVHYEQWHDSFSLCRLLWRVICCVIIRNQQSRGVYMRNYNVNRFTESIARAVAQIGGKKIYVYTSSANCSLFFFFFK